MSYIFFDESGDLGFDFSKKKTSNYFVVTFLFVNNKSSIEKIVKKIFRMLFAVRKKKHSGVLHAYKEKPITRRRLLSLLNMRDVGVFYVCLNKKKVYTLLKDKKHILYNYVVQVLLDRIFTKKLLPLKAKIYFVASKRETSVFLNKNFKNYLKNQVLFKHQANIEVQIKTPHEEKCLQVVDFVSWALFRKLEYREKFYYDLFKSKIIKESWLFEE